MKYATCNRRSSEHRPERKTAGNGVSASELKAGLYYLHIVSGNGELLYSNRIIIIH
jgi:hypothetical protein